VLFTIKLKAGLADNVAVRNRASIVFDHNEAILTPIWENKKDVVAPTSAMLKPVKIDSATVELKWNGTDNPGGSGIYTYNVYMKKNNGEYELYKYKTEATSAIFELEKDTKYAFYTIATDHAGNVETKTKIPDITYPLDKLPFDTYAVTKWNNTFMLNLRKLAEDGYHVTACKWFKNNQEIGEGFSYSAGQTIDDKLETGAVYYFEITTSNGDELSSTDKTFNALKSGLKAYPNPVSQGYKLTVEGTMPGAVVEIYNYMGKCVGKTIATDYITELTLALPPSIYIIRSGSEGVKVVVK
jgi:hypothetical protein